MDLRGLAPEDVYQLLGVGLNNKQLELMDQYRKDQLRQSAEQNQIANQFKSADDQRQMLRLQMEAGEVKADSPVNVDGKMVQRYHDKFGNVVREDVLGDAPQVDRGTKLLKDAEGNPYWAKPGDPLKPGSTYLASSDNGFSINDQYMLSFLKSGIESGLDKDGNEMDEVTRDNNMTLVNLNDKVHQFVKVPEVKSGWTGTKVVPKYVKLPKDPAQLKALPDTQVVGYDEEMRAPITMAEVRETAKRTGQPVEMVFKYLGLIK